MHVHSGFFWRAGWARFVESVHSGVGYVHSRVEYVHSRVENVHIGVESVHSGVENVHMHLYVEIVRSRSQDRVLHFGNGVAVFDRASLPAIPKTRWFVQAT